MISRTFHRALALLMASLMAMAAWAATYTPNELVKDNITVRSAANAQAGKIGIIVKGETFEADAPVDGWARVTLLDGQVGYVNAKYITLVQIETEETDSGSRFNFSMPTGKYDLRWMVWMILALICVLFVLHQINMEGAVGIWIKPILWSVLGLSEMVYFLFCYNPIAWVFDLSWWVIALAAIAFALAAFFQCGSMLGFAKTYSEDNAHVGLWSVPVCLVALLLVAWLAPDYAWIPAVVFLLAQLWQAFVIFRKVHEYQAAGVASISAVGYLLGMVGTLIMATLLLSLLLLVVMVIFAGSIVLGMLSGSKDIRLRHKWGSYFEDQYGHEWEHIGGNSYRRT